MSLCLATAAVALQLAAQGFTLSWIHSVERTEWQERWRVEGTELVLDQARVRGSGAGMDPGEGSVLKDGWWIWPGHDLTVPELNLAVSGATVSGWTLCTAGQGCHDLARWLTRRGQVPEQVRVSALAGSCEPINGSSSASAGSASAAPVPAPETPR